MKVLETGHIYQPNNRQTDEDCEDQTLRFINKELGAEHGGTTTQEVIRILIDRTRHCANCMPHWVNEQVIYHLRSALVLHEMRALQRKFEKGEYAPEYMPVGDDGHFSLMTEKNYGELDTAHLVPHRNDWERTCNHPVREKTEPKLIKKRA